MAIVFWGVSPHPPLLIPGVSDLARDKVQATEKALSDWAQALKEQEPDRIVLMSPHAPSERFYGALRSAAAGDGMADRH